MKNFLTILLLLGLGACSQEASPTAKPVAKPAAPFHTYAAKFAAVIIPDSLLTRLALPSYEEFNTQDSRRKLAAYVLAHSGDAEDLSFTASTGNTLPIVWNNTQTHVRILPDPKQQARDLQTFGVMIKSFSAGVSVAEENDRGQIRCDWRYGFGVHLKNPVGNSTDHGVDGPCGGGVSDVGQPEIWRVFRGDGVSVWMLIDLDRI